MSCPGLFILFFRLQGLAHRARWEVLLFRRPSSPLPRLQIAWSHRIARPPRQKPIIARLSDTGRALGAMVPSRPPGATTLGRGERRACLRKTSILDDSCGKGHDPVISLHPPLHLGALFASVSTDLPSMAFERRGLSRQAAGRFFIDLPHVPPAMPHAAR
ncbi:hypothetical protein DFH27DRAFT_77110 [Peziza echinospora]|nr:hypothetical protein DFH27DRAFT_77110 [Peziza echinospora]